MKEKPNYKVYEMNLRIIFLKNMGRPIEKKDLIKIGHTWDSYDDGLLCVTCYYRRGIKQELKLNSILKCWGEEYHVLYKDEYNDEQGHDTAYFTNLPYAFFESLGR